MTALRDVWRVRGAILPAKGVSCGSPQWEIEGFRRFQISEELRERYGPPKITEAHKRKLLGLDSARHYGITPMEDPEERAQRYPPVPEDYQSRGTDEFKTLFEFPGFTADYHRALQNRPCRLRRGTEQHGATCGMAGSGRMCDAETANVLDDQRGRERLVR